MAAGNYDVAMPAGRDDEIGELSDAFGIMAAKVRSHTQELEQRVQERTCDLEQVNRQMHAARKKIEDSAQDPAYIVTVHRVGYKFMG